MPELRQNCFTKAWVVIATERAKRPEQLIVHREPRPQARIPRTVHFARAMRTKRRPRCCGCRLALARGRCA